MDKDPRNKEAEGASSDEEEAFESADEGEEGAKSSKCPSATSAGIESANSTSKELVGTNDASVKTPVLSGGDINSETSKLDNNAHKTDENMPQEKEAKETSEEDIPCTATVDHSPCSEENIDSISAKLSEDVITKATESDRNDDEKREEFEAGKHEEGKSFATDRELEAEESTQGQNEQPLVNVDHEPRKKIVESSCSENAEDIKPSR